MSVSQPTRCLLRSARSNIIPKKHNTQPSACTNRSFHNTCVRQALRKHRPHYPSVKEEHLNQYIQKAASTFRPYTDKEWAVMKEQYTPAQIAAIRAAEEAVDPRDIATQGELRTDPWRVRYLDDFANIDSFVDVLPSIEPTQAIRYDEMDEDEWAHEAAEKLLVGGDSRSVEEMIEQVHQSPVSTKVKDFAERLRAYAMSDQEDDARMVLRKLTARIGQYDQFELALNKTPGGLSVEQAAEREKIINDMWLQNLGLEAKDELSFIKTADRTAFELALRDPRYSSEVPAVPRFNDPRFRFNNDEDDQGAAGLARLSQIMGWPVSQLRNIRAKRLVMHRVVNQTRMGKIDSQYTLFVAGNGDGLLGIGEGKAAEVEDSLRQGYTAAIRNMQPITRYEDRTIYGQVFGKSGATEVELSSRPPGFGVRCQHLIFEMCRVAGIHDLSARVTRARNPMNTIKATYAALMSQKLPEDIARARGRKLVDVRKVYYQGNVQGNVQ